jgi:hypothetical protein
VSILWALQRDALVTLFFPWVILLVFRFFFLYRLGTVHELILFKKRQSKYPLCNYWDAVPAFCCRGKKSKKVAASMFMLGRRRRFIDSTNVVAYDVPEPLLLFDPPRLKSPRPRLQIPPRVSNFPLTSLTLSFNALCFVKL